MEENSSSTLTKRTINQILRFIKENKIQSGDKLPTETELLKQFGVSRIILREAFSYLKGLGLIESRRGSGFRLADIDFAGSMEQVLDHTFISGAKSMAELMELRYHLELGTIYEAVENATKEDIECINKAYKRLEALCREGLPTFQEHQVAELEFHRIIMKPAQCRTLNIVNMAIRKFFEASQESGRRFTEAQMKNLQKELKEHAMIRMCFELGWPDIAVTCLRKHLLKR